MSECSSDGEETGNGELHDWEMLSASPKGYAPRDAGKDMYSCLPKPDVGSNPSCSLGILGDDSEGLIQPNYFAHPSSAMESPPAAARVVEDCALGHRLSSDDSDPSSWIDPSDADHVQEEDDGAEPGSNGAEDLGNQEAEPEPRAVDHKPHGRAWWKLPWGVWVFRVGPWSLAMAAAVMGFVILGRRWYRIRAAQNKSLSMRFHVNADDKRIRLLMFQAVRLNEAFSAVRRVPVVRAQVSFRGYHDGL